MILVAAVGLAMVPMRDLFARLDELSLPWDLTEFGWRIISWTWAERLCITSRPLALTIAAALWVGRIRRPRPSIRRVFRQPGMAASTAILASFALGLTGEIADVLMNGFPSEGFAEAWGSILVTLEALQAGKAVLAVWIILWLGRARRIERTWIDRAGRALGCYCLVETALFGLSVY